MEPLFDKPMSELREAFVRARFAEPSVFGRADIEDWLIGQYSAVAPSNTEINTWRLLLKRDELVDFVFGAVALLLLRYATLRDLGRPRHEPAGYSPLLPLVGQGLYWGMDNRGIYLHPNPVNTQSVYLVHGKAPEDHEHSLTFECAGRNNLRNIHQTVLEIIFAEWQRGDPKRDAARQCLHDLAEATSHRERVKAEHDFDEAVAVSYDGTKIVKAKWVVVVSDSAAKLYPGSAFHDRKAKLRHPAAGRLRFPILDDDSKDICAFLSVEGKRTLDIFRRPKQDYQVFDCGMQDQGFKLLFVHDDLCPSPLPEGGLEIKV